MNTHLLSTRENLILTAVEVIDELGIQGLSTREVAKRLGMSNAVLFNHFKSKNELIIAVLDHYIQYDHAILQVIKAKELKALEAIIYFFDSFATYYENYPAITAIIQAYDGLRCEKELEEKVVAILSHRSYLLKKMVEEAQSEGQLRSGIYAECIVDILLGSFRMICLNWRMNHYDFQLKERILYTLNVILNTLSNNLIQ